MTGSAHVSDSQSFIRQRIQPSGLHILFELPVPCLTVVLGKPGPERCQLFG